MFSQRGNLVWKSVLFFILQFPKKISSGMFFAPCVPCSTCKTTLPRIIHALLTCTSFILSESLFLSNVVNLFKIKPAAGNSEGPPHWKNSPWGLKSNQSCKYSQILAVVLLVHKEHCQLPAGEGGHLAHCIAKEPLSKCWIVSEATPDPKYSFLSLIHPGSVQAHLLL